MGKKTRIRFQNVHPGSYFRKLRNNFFKILNSLTLDPGSGMGCVLKNRKPGCGWGRKTRSWLYAGHMARRQDVDEAGSQDVDEAKSQDKDEASSQDVEDGRKPGCGWGKKPGHGWGRSQEVDEAGSQDVNEARSQDVDDGRKSNCGWGRKPSYELVSIPGYGPSE
jgi:hypothetical protein